MYRASPVNAAKVRPSRRMGGWVDGWVERWGSPLWVAILELKSARSREACRALLQSCGSTLCRGFRLSSVRWWC